MFAHEFRWRMRARCVPAALALRSIAPRPVRRRHCPAPPAMFAHAARSCPMRRIGRLPSRRGDRGTPLRSTRRARSVRPAALPRASETGQRALLRELVPGADQLAVVAAVDPVAHQRPQLHRNRPAMLDGQVRDAPPRIEPLRRHDRLRRAHVDAGAAAAAVRGARGSLGGSAMST